MKSIKLNRFAAGFLAAVLAAPVTVLAGIIDVRIFRRLHWQGAVGVFLGVTAAVLWFGEEHGLIAEPYRSGKDDPLSLK
jgi:hypothetical protein